MKRNINIKLYLLMFNMHNTSNVRDYKCNFEDNNYETNTIPNNKSKYNCQVFAIFKITRTRE